jgi:hypothetical protein
MMNFGFVCFRLHHVGGSEFGCFKEEKRLEYYYNYLIYNILFLLLFNSLPIVYIYSNGFVPIRIADEMEGRESPAKLHFFSPPSDLISPDTKLDQLPKEFFWAIGTIPYNHICFYQKPRIGLIRRYSFSQKINGIS